MLFDSFLASAVYHEEYLLKNKRWEIDKIMGGIRNNKTVRGFIISSSASRIVGGAHGVALSEEDPSVIEPIKANPVWRKLEKTHKNIFYWQKLGIFPEYRKKGYAKKLTRMMYEDLSSVKYNLLLTRTANQKFYLRFYRHLPGFIPIVMNVSIPGRLLSRNYFAFKLEK